MSFSLNETEALCRKAARGAGFDWGLAEEAGRAARWLHMQGLPGTQALLAALDQPGESPMIAAGHWRGATGALCPIRTGATLADFILAIGPVPDKPGLSLAQMRVPLLLLGFVNLASAASGQSLCLSSDGVRAVILLDDLDLSGSFDPIADLQLHVVRAPRDLRARQTRAIIATDVYHRLDAYAQRTYAPATEASRRAGAGSGLSDND